MDRSTLFLGVALACAAAHPAFSAPSSEGFRADLPAAGRHDTVVTLSQWGRYSLRTSGGQPVAVAVADKRNGMLRKDGEPGQRHGRIDLFLDLGEYKLTVQGPKKAAGDAGLALVPFAPVPGSKPAWLLPLRENRFQLDDLQEASYWFETASDTTVWLEAAGRNLAEMAVWRDGEWRVPANFGSFTAKPAEGMPWNGYAGGVFLTKGAYRVGLYGGEPRAWSERVGEHPAFLRMGLDTVGAGARSLRTLPPQGYETLLLGAGVAQLVIEESEKRRLSAEVTRLDAAFASTGWMAGDSIHGKSASPRMLLVPGAAGQGGRMLRVSGSPGQVYSLQTFGPCACDLYARQAAEWRVASVHSGNPGDGIGASGAVVDLQDGSLVAVAADTVGAREVARRFNLVERMTTFIWIPEAGDYAFAPTGTRYKWSLGRYFLRPPRNHVAPEIREGAAKVALNAGLHVLTLDPAEKGIAGFVLGKASLLGGLLSAGKQALGLSSRAWDAPRPEIRFDRIVTAGERRYAVLLNSQAPELSSVSVRRLPLDPDEPVGLWLMPGEKAVLPLKLAGKRVLSVRDMRGAAFPFEAGGRRIDQTLEASGNLTVALTGAGEARRVFLAATPPERLPEGPAPEFPDAARAALPRFPLLEPDRPLWLDLARGAERVYALRVARPGLYRLETTGRLQTGLQLADRFRNFVRSAEANGVARNALLLEYLLPGEYQLTVSARGQSAGRLGLSVGRNAWTEAGSLAPGIDNRKAVEAFTGAAYGVRIPAAGRYRFESQGLNGGHTLRLEDARGWPVEPATAESPRTETLDPGAYRLFSLPSPQAGRRVARLTPLAEKRAIKGKGPHPLALNTALASTWMDEGKGDSIGAPAVFTFSLPAPISAKLLVSNGFKASLYRDGSDTAVAVWSGTRKTRLPMGGYRMRVVPEKKRNLAPYQVSVGTRDLIPGLSFDLSSKETFAVSLGTPGIVEFGSQGMLDAAATLLAEDGRTVLAANDDGYLDWNFSISRALPAGRYFLRAESAEPGFSRTTVFMRALTDTAMDTLAADGSGRAVERRLNRRLGVFPLAAGPGDIVACAARGATRVGLSLEKAGAGGAWISVAQDGGLAPSVSVPRTPGARYRLKAWSEADADEPIVVGYASAASRSADARQAAAGLAGQTEMVGGSHRAWFKVDLGSPAPGFFRAASEQNPLGGLAVSAAPDTAFDGGDGAEFSALSRNAWVEMRFEQAGRFQVKLEPVTLGEGGAASIALDGNRPRVIATRRAGGSAGLLRIETDGAHPLAGPLASGASGPRFRMAGIEALQSLWMGAGAAAAAVLPDDNGNAAVWNAAPSGDGVRPMARLSWTSLPVSDGGAVSPGVGSWEPGKPAARILRLPAGRSWSVRVTLPPQGAALLRRPDGARELECDFDGEPRTREFRAEGGELYLFALDAKARFGFAVYSAAADPAAYAPLAERAGRSLGFSAEGLELIPIAAAVPAGIFYRGAALKTVSHIGADGRLREDLRDGAKVGPGGLLALRHGPGKARIDLCGAGDAASVMACKWAAPLAASDAREISQSSLSPLHDRANWYAFALRDTQHVNFASPTPLAAILLRDGAPYRYQEAWERFNWDLPLPPGRYALGIRPFGGASLEGASLAGLFRPIPAVSERNPFTAYLAPGESRLLRFDVARRGTFGVGLRMGRETAEARLYDAQGRVAAQGKQQFVQLAPGPYYLWLRVPENTEGTEVTALIFGQEAPPNEPPERLVKWIVNGAAGERPDTRTEQEAEPENARPAWERLLKRRYDEGSGYNAEEASPAGEESGAAEEEGSGSAGEEDGDSDAEGDGDAGNEEGEGE